MSNVIMGRFGNTPNLEFTEDWTDEDANEIADDFFRLATKQGKRNFMECVVNDDRIMDLVWTTIAAKSSHPISVAGNQLAVDMIKANNFDMGRA